MGTRAKHDITAIKIAINIVGNGAILADKLGVSRQMVNYWVKGNHNLAAKHVIPIEKLTGGMVRRHNLRPDIYPEE